MIEEDKIGFCVLCILVLLGILLFFIPGCIVGERQGYIQALDDARLGKPAKYKLEQTAEKWVEVRE